MKPTLFVKKYYPYARQTEAKVGISALFTLGQAALESGWGEHAPGNMFFGVKDTDGLNGNEQLIVTTEYSLRANCKAKDLGLVSIMSVEPRTVNGIKRYKYTGQAYFRKYDTPEESFTEHCSFFLNNKRYAQALDVKDDPYAFADAIAKAGYATDPSYASLLKSVIKSVEKALSNEKTVK